MKNFFKRESGSTLAITLIVMVVLTILGTALLNLSLAENKFANWSEDKLQAYYIARSGAQAVAEYMINPEVPVNLVGKSATNTQIPGGNIVVSVTEDAANPNILYITSNGTYKNSTQTAKIKMAKTPVSTNFLFENAIVASTLMSNEGSGSTSVVTGSVLSSSLSNIFPPPNPATVTGTKSYDPMLPDLLADVSINQTPYPATSVDIDDDIILNTSAVADYYLRVGTINLNGGNRVLRVNGPGVTHLYVTGNIAFLGNAGIFVDADATLCIYKETPGTIIISGSGSIINNTYIYAPNSTVDFNNNNSADAFQGAIIGQIVKIPNKISVVYVDLKDEVDIDVSGVGLFYSGYVWID